MINFYMFRSPKKIHLDKFFINIYKYKYVFINIYIYIYTYIYNTFLF